MAGKKVQKRTVGPRRGLSSTECQSSFLSIKKFEKNACYNIPEHKLMSLIALFVCFLFVFVFYQ